MFYVFRRWTFFQGQQLSIVIIVISPQEQFLVFLLDKVVASIDGSKYTIEINHALPAFAHFTENKNVYSQARAREKLSLLFVMKAHEQMRCGSYVG